MESPVGSLGKGVRGECLELFEPEQVFTFDPILEGLELAGIVTVVDPHGVPDTDEAVVLESAEPAHSLSSSRPVGTSAEHIGQVATAISPTTKLNPHSGQLILGSIGGGAAGSGGA
jgi:hypothetical protein